MRRRLTALALAGTLLLAGCASGEPTYDPAAAEELQARVLTVSEASASGDLQGAMTRLDELVVVVNDALARGAITPERHQAIMSAIELVRADLVAAIEAAKPDPVPAPPVEESDNSDNDDDDDEKKNNGNEGNGEGNNKDDEGDNNDGDKKKDKDEESSGTSSPSPSSSPTESANPDSDDEEDDNN